MDLSERIGLIQKGSGLNQREFATSIGVTESYISLLLKGKTEKISESLALLIECKYGYSAKWTISGGGNPKETAKKNTFARAKTKHLLDRLDERGLMAVEAFINSIDEIKRIYEQTAGIETVAAHNDAKMTDKELKLMQQDADDL